MAGGTVMGQIRESDGGAPVTLLIDFNFISC